MKYSSLLQVPNTTNGELMRKLIGMEVKLSRISGYNVKLVERSGTQLARLFQRVFTPPTCHWLECPVCLESDGTKPTKCRLSNIVYEGRCLTCVGLVGDGKLSNAEVGVYIGESGRTLAERSSEHVAAAKSIEEESFIVKHWIQAHPDLDEPPRFKFQVKKLHSDPLSRMVSESVLIESVGNLNSKSEWRNNKVVRLKVDNPEWIERKLLNKREEEDRKLSDLINLKRPKLVEIANENDKEPEERNKLLPTIKRGEPMKRKKTFANDNVKKG